ncbi:delta-1-pyrroline-5-carboxylate synthase-like isoform X3 [Apium graveolens]|uniref:delta-1-pyrroline-5-carboxylate synthase-like isoform X3 n=1 Tax=Apium graveolens TaxID=4045 RepID=UPI003D7A6CFB
MFSLYRLNSLQILEISVYQIKASTKLPVLGHADGICYVYVDKSTNIEMAKQIVLDAKMDYPAACNVMETLIVHKDLMQRGAFNELITELQIKGTCDMKIQLLGCLQGLRVAARCIYGHRHTSCCWKMYYLHWN